ncbi:MAG: adenylate/guanylate cyclase domain-containing protein [Melioribacteraceae bacterium]|nr:adenylate/guanylate cyclase domain-containing protein [Melioribacteraceae bacterium]
MSFRKNKKSGSGGLIKLATFLTSFILVIFLTQEFFFTFGPLKSLELKLIDERFSQRGERNIKDTADVVILAINQETYDQIPHPYKTWPWPRFIFQKVIENLQEAGVRAIGIDIIMSSPDRMDKTYDSLLMDCMRKYGNIVVAGKIDLAQEAQLEAFESGRTSTLGVRRQLDYDFENIFFHADSSIGIVQTPGDYDEVYRRYQTYVNPSTYPGLVPSFGFALINKFLGLPPDSVAKKDKSGDHFILGFKKIPVYDKTTMLINFYGADRTFPRIEFSQVLDDNEFTTETEILAEEEWNEWDILLSSDPEIFEDKIVIIGSSMPEDKDFFNIPISRGTREGDNIIAGVEFHANVIQNIIWDDYLYKQSQFQEIIILLIISFLVFYGSSYIKQKKVKHHFVLEVLNLVLVLLLIYLVYIYGIYVFTSHNLVVSMINPILAILLSYFSVTAYNFITERTQNKMIRGMFSTYVSSDLVNILLKEPDKLKLGGEKRTLSILFSDIAGFTSFSEKLQPEELVEFINEYLTEMTDIVLANSGTLDKYIGDAIMAFWGAPISIEKHEYLACKTAIEMQKRLKHLREKWKMESAGEINVRIGINSGAVVVGNIGGRSRFDYTVMGDQVNLASRLEGANKQYGTGIMISDSTYEIVKKDFLVRELDTIRVKGKLKPTTVYELIGFKDDEDAVKKFDLLKGYIDGLKAYKLKDFDKAIKFFNETYNSSDRDKASLVYIERSKYYMENPPDTDWDGVFVMQTK